MEVHDAATGMYAQVKRIGAVDSVHGVPPRVTETEAEVGVSGAMVSVEDTAIVQGLQWKWPRSLGWRDGSTVEGKHRSRRGLSLVPDTHSGWFTTTCNQGDLVPPSGLCGQLHMCVSKKNNNKTFLINTKFPTPSLEN